MSEILELYKTSYQRNLMELRKGKKIFKEDMEAVDTIKGNWIYKIMPIIKRQVVITKKGVI